MSPALGSTACNGVEVETMASPRIEPAAHAPTGASAWPTLANGISLARLVVAAPLSIYAVFAQRWWLAAGIFVAAVASDFLDGFCARRRQTVSALGGILDHGTDALYVTVTLWAIAYAEAQQRMDAIPGILPFFIALAFGQYMLDSRALAGMPLRGSRLGRINGIAYFVLVGIVLFRNALELGWLTDAIIYWCGLALVVSTLASMFNRLQALTALTKPAKPTGTVDRG